MHNSWKSVKNVLFKKYFEKSYRCPKFGGDGKDTLEIRGERKRNLKLGVVGEVSFGIYKLGQLGE